MTSHLGELQQLVMLAVARVGEREAFGGSIQEELEAVAGRSVAVGTVYVTLVRLEDQGLVASRPGDGAPGKPGRPRKLFSITGAGWEALRASKRSLTLMWEGVEPA